MGRIRKRFDAAFKAKVVLEAIKNEKKSLISLVNKGYLQNNNPKFREGI